jgi:glycerol-3-phosphate dehydrogenase
MPIVEKVYEVLYNGLNPKDALYMLMTREQKSE